MPLKPEVLDRLLLSKSFLEKTRFQPIAAHDRHTLAAAIIATHDAAELAIAAVCDQLGCLPQRNTSFFMDYFGSYKEAQGTDLPGRSYFRNLNSARNLLKHQGLFPDVKQWSRVGEVVFHYVAKWCADTLHESLADLDESALLLDTNVKRLYDEAKRRARNGDYKGTLEELALALTIVFEKNGALRGFEAGKASTEDAIRVVGFGIHGNDFLALQQFLPHVSSWGKEAGIPKWKQSQFGHPGNWREHCAEFCLRAFVDVAIKLQSALWIPGPLSRDLLYDQQIEALNDDVEFWRNVPDESSGEGFAGLFGKTRRETKSLLAKGEKLRAFVRLSSAGSASAILGGAPPILDGPYLSVMPLAEGSLQSWDVRASDVKVTCIPKQSEFVREYFPWLPEIDWVAE